LRLKHYENDNENGNDNDKTAATVVLEERNNNNNDNDNNDDINSCCDRIFVILEELEKQCTWAKLKFYDLEHSYKRSSGILNDSCTTVSRIMYQLQNFQKDKNVEVYSSNVIEYLSHIG